MQYEHNGDIKATYRTDLLFKNWPWRGTPQNPLTVQFTDTSQGSPDSWHWDFGDDEFSREQNPSHTFYGPIGTVKMWAWKDATETLPAYDSNTGNYKNGWQNPEPEWPDQWNKVLATTGTVLGMVVMRKASVDPFSTSKRCEMAYTTVTRDMTPYANNFLTLIQTSNTFNNTAHWDSAGLAPASGMTVSCYDSSLARINNDLLYRRDYNLTDLMTLGVDLGDVGNLGNNPDYAVTSFTWTDWGEMPYDDFHEMAPDWLPSWPSLLDEATGYWMNIVSVVEIRTFDSDHWGWISYNFDDYPFDFYGTPRVGIAMLTVQFTDLSTVYITEWDWDFGDGTIKGVTAGSTHQHPVHMYNYYA
jgi:PKD repeat protein